MIVRIGKIAHLIAPVPVRYRTDKPGAVPERMVAFKRYVRYVQVKLASRDAVAVIGVWRFIAQYPGDALVGHQAQLAIVSQSELCHARHMKIGLLPEQPGIECCGCLLVFDVKDDLYKLYMFHAGICKEVYKVGCCKVRKICRVRYNKGLVVFSGATRLKGWHYTIIIFNHEVMTM